MALLTYPKAYHCGTRRREPHLTVCSVNDWCMSQTGFYLTKVPHARLPCFIDRRPREAC
jgi:hypothetical protein